MPNKLPMKEAVELIKAIDETLTKKGQTADLTINIIQNKIDITIVIRDEETAADLQSISNKIKILTI